jgi:hypothetical protein
VRVRISSFVRLLVGLAVLCLILGGAHWPLSTQTPRGDADPHFEAATATAQVWIADQPADSSSVPLGQMHTATPFWVGVLLSMSIGLLCIHALRSLHRAALQLPRTAGALVGIVELRI